MIYPHWFSFLFFFFIVLIFMVFIVIIVIILFAQTKADNNRYIYTVEKLSAGQQGF